MQNKHLCTKCFIDGRKLTWEKFYERIKKNQIGENGNLKYEYLTNNFPQGEKTILTIKCKKCGNIFHQLASVHMIGCGCSECKKEKISKALKYTEEEYKEKCRIIYGNKYDLSELNYQSSTDYITPICPIHGKFKIYATNFLKGNGCTKCKIIENTEKQKKENKVYISECEKVHGKGRYIYLTEYKGSKKDITFQCTKCGKITTKNAGRHLKGVGCSFCSSSKLEREVRVMLENNNIKFTAQYQVKRQSLDFYLDDYNIGIECQGSQHFKNKFIFKRKEIKQYKLDETIERDIRKYNYCNENGIKLIYYTEPKLLQPELINNEKFGNIYQPNNIFSNLDDLLNYITNYGK